jgi:A/G-specific adenine glycosylase
MDSSVQAPDAAALLAWYDRHARKLPWRVGPKERAAGVKPDPYRVWLSEVMLQQTTVGAVLPFYDAFLARWPTVEALAAAPRDEVMKAWAGLGYYSRARNLKAAAEAVVRDHGGRFPETSEGMRTLPGVGPYIAAAVAAVAHDEPAAVVDANVERVIARVFAIETPLPQAKNEIRERQAELTPAERAGDYAQAVMDLGSLICTPKKPACSLCPWNDACRAYAAGNPELYPMRKEKAQRPVRAGVAFIAVRPDGAVLLRSRPDKGLLGGMAEVPGSIAPGLDLATAFDAAPFDAEWTKVRAKVAHVFTHFRLEMTVFRAEVAPDLLPPAGYWWSTPDELAGEALPTAMKKAIAAAVPDAFRRGRKRAA